MVDVPEGEIPQLVRPKKKPFMDGETPLHSPEQVEAVTKVFDDDDLLREIIVRVGFPTTLVRAALVCKRWLEHASDRKFLNHFRKLHPPRLLGFYISKGLRVKSAVPRFVSMLPQPPELATVIRRLESYSFGSYKAMRCQNGIFLTTCRIGEKWTHGVHRPLCAEKGMQIFPPLPHVQDRSPPICSALISKEEGSCLSYLYLLVEKSMACVYMLEDGGWRMHTSAACHGLYYGKKALLVDNKIYMPAGSPDHIMVFDLTASSFSKIQLPQGVKCHYFTSMLSRADDASSVYLIHVEAFQLRVWLHKGDTWLLVNTICLHEMLATLGISDHTLENEGMGDVQINQVGDIGQFVFLRMGKCIFFLDIKCRTMCKVYENTVNGLFACSIHPFMMIWPPTFPATKDNPARNGL